MGNTELLGLQLEPGMGGVVGAFIFLEFTVCSVSHCTGNKTLKSTSAPVCVFALAEILADYPKSNFSD